MPKRYVIRTERGAGLYYVGPPEYWSEDENKAVTEPFRKDLVRIRDQLLEVSGDVKIVEILE